MKAPTGPRPANIDVRSIALQSLAELRNVAVADLDQQMGAQRDIFIESVEAVVIISHVEAIVGRRLVRASDLDPDDLTALATVIRILSVKLTSASEAEA